MRQPLTKMVDRPTKAVALWTPPPIWKDQDAFLIGGGSSLTGFDFGSLKGRNVIGCNDAAFLGWPPLSYCIFGDSGWWHRNRLAIEKMSGPFVTNAPAVHHYILPNVLKMGRTRDGIHTGSMLGWNNSTGALAINLAVSLGATRIFLLGYDLSNQNNKSHWHKYNLRLAQPTTFAKFIRGFSRIDQDLRANYPGVQIFNVTDGGSQLKTWPTISFLAFQQQLSSIALVPKREECVP